jgi:SAM-dependent methyltransferase
MTGMTEDEIRTRLKDYTFYHIIRLTDAISTPGVPTHVLSQKTTLRRMDAIDFKGKRVLDIGCRDGLFAFEAERRGASEVIGIDNDLSKAAVEFLIPFFDSRVRMYEMNLLDLKPETFGRFDIVIFAGVLYHLRFPFHGLRLIRDALRENGELILETAVFADDNRFALLYCPVGPENPYDQTCPTLFNLKGLVDTLLTFGIRVDHAEFQYSGEIVHPQVANGASVRIPHPGYDPASATKAIDRVALLGRMAPELRNERLTEYWEGTQHKLHTVQGEADRVLGRKA